MPPDVGTDDDLYARGAATLLASWEEYARGARHAALHRLAGVAAAVFPHEPERSVYNNSFLERALSARDRTDALDAMEAAYATAAVDRFAAWVHEDDRALRHELERRGYSIDTTTRAMGMVLGETRLARSPIEPRTAGLARTPPHRAGSGGASRSRDPTAYRVAVARLDGESVSTALAYALDGDCGIYNVGTLAHARRRGLATGVTATLLHDALASGCETASLQATPMAERLYASLGFRDLGRIFEYVPTVRGRRRC